MAVHLMSFHGSIVGVLCMLDSGSLCMSTGSIPGYAHA